MATYMIFISGKGALYGYTADEPPKAGDVITPDTTDWRVIIESAEPGEDGELRYFGSIDES